MRLSHCLPWVLLTVLTAPALAAGPPLALDAALDEALATYAPLRSARLRAERARYDLQRVESQLGWEFAASAGARRDLSLASTPADTVAGSAGINRALASGGKVTVEAGVDRVDNGFSLGPDLPDPATTARFDLAVRTPLLRGEGNPAYTQGLTAATARFDQADAEWRALRDDLAERVLDLYFAAALTRAQISTTTAALDRARRLQTFITDNARLGLSEQKDQLAAAAQVKARQADLDSLQVRWTEQRTALNRLLGRNWNAEFSPHVDAPAVAPDSLERLDERAQAASPALRRARARLNEAQAAIELKRDAQRDALDLVYSAGARQRGGDSGNGEFQRSELVGGVAFEYRRSLDRRGVDAELAQALLDRDAALQDIRAASEDARYQAASLRDQIEAGGAARSGLQERLRAERAKLDEAVERYRDGRTDTARLIDIESDLRAAELALSEQDISLARARARLQVLTGDTWRRIANAGNGSP